MGAVYQIQSPTRVDLAGGTLDLWPLYAFFGGAQTVNLAIDIYTGAELELRAEAEGIEIESLDLKQKKFYSHYESVLQDTDPSLALYRVVLDYFKPPECNKWSFRLRTTSQSPVGGGLGGSSSLMISLLKVFSKAFLKPFASTAQMVMVAHNLEAQMLLTPTGTQDYYPAVTGGINILEYSASGIRQNLYQHQALAEIEDRFLLVYTGRSHHSGMNNFEVLQKAVARDPQTIRALSQLRGVAHEMSARIRAGHWHDLAELFQREYQARIQLAPAVMSPEIETLHRVALGAGAEAVKICGAGGGGCVLVWCRPGTKARLTEVCTTQGFEVLKAKPLGILAAVEA